jgi:F0F1-type ATP synthase membrane subunit b/b'
MAEAALGLSNALNSIDEKIKSAKTFVQVKQDSKKLQQDITNNLEQAKNKTTTSVNKLKDQKKDIKDKLRVK